MPRDLFESNLTQAVDDGAPQPHLRRHPLVWRENMLVGRRGVVQGPDIESRHSIDVDFYTRASSFEVEALSS